jgi:hypothetical protein
MAIKISQIFDLKLHIILSWGSIKLFFITINYIITLYTVYFLYFVVNKSTIYH